jgi:hypothetical protein
MMLICRMEILSRSGSTVIPPHLGYRLMKSYRVLVLCDYCDRAHPTGITLDLDDDLSNKQTVAEAFKDKTDAARDQQTTEKCYLMPRVGDVRNAN